MGDEERRGEQEKKGDEREGDDKRRGSDERTGTEQRRAKVRGYDRRSPEGEASLHMNINNNTNNVIKII